MRFKIDRTSIWDNEKQPCDEAVKESYTNIDVRTVDNASKLNGKNAEQDWYSNGTNHRVENGKIKRDFNVENWFVYINTFEEMIAFTEKYGELILGKDCNSNGMSLEIYDNYRE